MSQTPRKPRRTLKQPNELYYTASQAKARLGVNDRTFYDYVEAGELQKIVPRGRKHGLYLRSEVDQLARDISVFFITRKKTSSVFAVATSEDIPACVDITVASLQGGGYVHFTLASAETRLAWMKRNPELFYTVKDDGQIMAYASIVPMLRETIERVFRNELNMRDVAPDDILPFAPGVPVDIYLMTLVVRPGLSLSEKRAYGMRLISGLMSTLVDLGRRGVVIRDIYARSNTPDGIRILRNLGCTRIPSTTDMQNYVIHVKESGIPAIMEYKTALSVALAEQKES